MSGPRLVLAFLGGTAFVTGALWWDPSLLAILGLAYLVALPLDLPTPPWSGKSKENE